MTHLNNIGPSGNRNQLAIRLARISVWLVSTVAKSERNDAGIDVARMLNSVNLSYDSSSAPDSGQVELNVE